MGNDTSVPCGDYDDYYKDRNLQKDYAWSDTNNTETNKFAKNGNLMTSADRRETRDTRGAWFFTAIAAALIPIIILFVSQVVMARQNDGFRWRLWRDDKSRIVLWVAYIWMFILFVFLVWYGWKMALTTRASHNMRTLIGALFIFWNLAAMVCLLVMGMAVSYRDVDGNWAAQFPVFLAIAAFCFYLFGIVWFALVWRRLNRKQQRSGAFNYKSREDVMPADDDVNIRSSQNNSRYYGNDRDRGYYGNDRDYYGSRNGNYRNNNYNNRRQYGDNDYHVYES